MQKILKVLLPLIVLIIFYVFFKNDYGAYFSLNFLKANQLILQKYFYEHQVQTVLVYFGVYVLTTALSLPGATILTLAGGAIFGFSTGLIIVSFASTLGATLAFLTARFLLRDWVQKKFSYKLHAINEGVKKEGGFYLFTLRLLPVFPFFLINLLMGLTPIGVIKFFFVSQLGMLAGTAVYVNAGLQLSKLNSLSGILSPQLLGSFALLGFFPLLSKKLLDFFKAQKVYGPYKKPKQFEYNMVVIGAGSAGLVSAYIASAVKAKVALIEKNKMGGDCLNTGCVPSKALIKSASIVRYKDRANEFGLESIDVKFDFAKVMERVHKVIDQIEPHDSIERYTKLGVECIQGEAKIISPWEVEVDGKVLTTKNIVVATGAAPLIPRIPGLENIDYVVSDNLWDIRNLPKKFLVLGGGPIGLEMAQSFSRFGSDVTVVEMSEQIMPKEDEDISQLVTQKLKAEEVNLLTSHKAVGFRKDGDRNIVELENNGAKTEVEFDLALVAIGRKPNIKGFGLEDLKIEIRENGTIEANEYLQTNYPNIYVCGDVTGPYQLTHTASHQAWYCAVNSLFGKLKKFKVDYSVIPWCTYTDPEVATVGLNEKTAKANGISYEVTTYGIDDLDRAIADSENFGIVKVLTVPGKDKILGATIVGKNAGNLIIEFISAMKHGFGLNKILGTIHIYPTLVEANKYVAGNWKRAQTSPKVLNYLEKFHRLMR